ncbi:MAG: orotate phosphoribosyltransferase [bacterium]|nr:orotate phosphoribosyltransferase [bacterium]
MNTLDILTEAGAILEGHFLLSSGLHSNKYVQCARVLQYPDMAEDLARKLGDHLFSRNADMNVDVVVSPAIGGIVIGQEMARVLKCRAIFTERENNVMRLRRGFEIKPGEKCLVVEDVITTGGSTKEVMEAVREHKGELVGTACIIDRSKLEDFCVSLVKLKIDTFQAHECPLCKVNIPLVKPGSKQKA